MAIKVAILVASALIAAPAVAAFATANLQNSDTVSRAVQLSGPIVSFTQTQDRIQVRLQRAPGDAQPHAIVVSAPGADTIRLPLHESQTWLSAKLPATLAAATQIAVSVE